MLKFIEDKIKFDQLLGLPRSLKILILIINDLIISYFVTWLSFFLRIEFFDVEHTLVLKFFLLNCFIFIPLFFIFRVYHSLSRYFSINFIFDLFISTIVFIIILLFILFYFSPSGIPRSLSIIYPVFFMIFIILSRLFFVFFINISATSDRKNKTIIYGAGDLGNSVSKILIEKGNFDIVGFIDNNSQKIGRKINNIKIFSHKELDTVVKKYNVDSAVLSIKKISGESKKEIITNLSRLKLKTDIVDVNLDINEKEINLRKINLNDIIESKRFIKSEKYTEIKDQTILVSGAGGSIGSELVKQIIKSIPKTIILLDNSEYNLFIINREIQKLIDVKHYDIKIICKLVSITDLENLNDIFNEHKPQQVFHAAAYKHVSLVEKNPIESIKNNVIGTLNIVDCAINYNVSRFLFISTDKAVKPTTIMGKTKRLGEKIIKEKVNDKKCNTIFSIVRFGNVLGSSGSVIPLFIEQIESGGPITLTHKDIKRYFMTIEDAVSLVLEASQFAKGGEIYLLDMGKSIKIYDIALKLINLSGLTLKDRNNSHGDIEIKITGLDPIEKLDEELIIAGSTKKTINPSIFEVDADISIQENFFTKINDIKSSLVLENKKHVLNLLNSLNLN